MDDPTRIVYIHGDGVTHWSWGWVGKLKAQLDDAGLDTFFELFPDSIEARARYWMPFLEQQIVAGSRDVLLGWSCGTLAAMRYAEKTPVRGLVLVSPFHKSEHPTIINSGFLAAPWNWQNIKRNAAHITMFYSTDDPHIEAEQFTFIANQLDATAIEVPGAGHFNQQTAFPELTDHLLATWGGNRDQEP